MAMSEGEQARQQEMWIETDALLTKPQQEQLQRYLRDFEFKRQEELKQRSVVSQSASNVPVVPPRPPKDEF